MYFKRLEIHGFKSFADPIVIDFHEGITCVVGPNGSGKSNISDAIRWVLGEQSPKTLRGGKMEEIIFAGTQDRKSKGMAEVTLVIDNSSHILDIEYSEVAITRRMYRSGESEYLINNAPCRLKDIRNLIMDTGIGVDGYSVIGQGKIADMVSSKTESRREIFEEAAGVVAYKTKRAEAERRLETTRLNLDRLEDILNEITGRMELLEKERAKAEEYLSIKKEYDSLEVNIILHNLANVEEKNNELRDDLLEAKERLIEEEAKLNHIKDKYRGNREEERELQDKMDSLQKELSEATEKLNALNHEASIGKERLDNIQKEKTQLKETLDRLRALIEDDDKNILVNKEALKEVEVNLETLNATLDARTGNRWEKERETRSIETEIQKHKDLLFSLHKELSSKTAQEASLAELRNGLLERLNEIDGELKSSAESLTQVKGDSQRQEKELIEKTTRIKDASERVRECEDKLIKLRQILNDGEDRLKNVELNMEKSKERLDVLTELQSNYDGYNGAVRFIMSKGISGIVGVVADQMHTEEKYFTAIETALGSSMQNIICETQHVAKDAINMLKASAAGRLTFLPRDAVAKSTPVDTDYLKGMEGFIGKGIELIQCEEKDRHIFNYLLGKTVVAKDMNSAISISKAMKQKLRIVTISGEVLAPWGAMSGGAYKNKSANLLQRPMEIQKLQDAMHIYNNECERLREDIARTRSQVEQEEEERTVLLEGIAKLNVDISVLEKSRSSIEQQLSEAHISQERMENRRTEISSDIKQADEMIRNLKDAVAQLNADIKASDSSLEQLIPKLEQKQKELAEGDDSYQSLQLEVSKEETKREGVIKLLTQQELLRESRNQEMERYDNRMQAIMEEEKDACMLLTKDKGERSSLSLSCHEINSNLEKYKDRRSELWEEITKDEATIASMEEGINRLQERAHILNMKLMKGETQEEALKERMWTEFEMSLAQAMEKKRDDFTITGAIRANRENKNRLRAIGDVNIGSIKEHEEVSERYNFLSAQKKDIVQAKNQLESIIKEMNDTIKTRFKENFDKVVLNFTNVFKELFGGGYAELRLDDESNPLESSIEIVAQPPGKKLQNINLMSGGEKTMTAIALMFAVLKAKPTPFCILDEVEAALDDRNIEKFSKYLRNFEDIQFVLVTHQKATMEHADVLYGITMAQQGVSQVLSLKMDK